MTNARGEWTNVFRRFDDIKLQLPYFGEVLVSLPMLTVPFLLFMWHPCFSCNGYCSPEKKIALSQWPAVQRPENSASMPF